MRVVLIAVLLLLGACAREGEDTIAVGTLERDRAELRAAASERVTSIEVNDGATVTAGQVLLRLDNAAAQARLNRLRAELSAAHTHLAQSHTELKRQQKLRDDGLGSEQALDAARERWQVAQAAEQAAAAAVTEQQVRADELTVAAPYDGRVEKVLVEVGDRPAAGSPLVTVYRAGAPYARVLLPAELQQGANPGDSFVVEVDGRGCFRAELRYIASQAAFTPYYALREQDRGRLVYAAEMQLPQAAASLPTGIPVSILGRATCESVE